MSGTIIEIRRHREVRQDRAGRQRRLEQQIARITTLLDELDDLKGDGETAPAWLLAQVQATLHRARDRFPPAQAVLHGVPEDPDPQPQVDRDALERMYRSLDPRR